MNWNRLFSVRSYLKSSLWVVPFIAIPIELIATRLVHGLDARYGWSLLDYSVSGSQALLQTIVTATLSFVVFTFGSLLVAVQVASAQMTPGSSPPRCCETTLSNTPLVSSFLR